ncbi:MAG: right-handed parallel beta-helix repeat-containing protein [Verrucomicrobiales bacterium]
MKPAICTLAALCAFGGMGAAAETRVADRESLVRALRTAKPGSTILLEPGKYPGGLSQAGLRGTADQPIVIAAADADDPPVIEGGASGIQLSSPEHVEWRDLVITSATANGLNIDDGGSAAAPAQHVTLKNIVVRDVGPRGNRDGIKLSGVAHFRIEGCRIERWGSGGSAIDMVGCRAGVITGCTFKDAGGDMANGVQTKGGSSEIVVQRCRFENFGGRGVNIGGNTGLPFFRPKDAPFEAQAITVEDCEFLGGQAAIAFVGVDGAIVRHNTIYRPRRWPVRILQENQDPRFVPSRRGKFEHNIIVFRADEVRESINIGSHTAPDTFQFASNVWYCLDRPADTQRLVRLPTRESNGAYGIEPGLEDPENGNLTVRDGKHGQAGVRP